MADYQIKLGMSDGSTVTSNKFSIEGGSDTKWTIISSNLETDLIRPDDTSSHIVNYFDENWSNYNGTLKLQFYYTSYDTIKVVLTFFINDFGGNYEEKEYNGYMLFAFDVNHVGQESNDFFPNNEYLQKKELFTTMDYFNINTKLDSTLDYMQDALETNDQTNTLFSLFFNLIYIELTKGEKSTLQFLNYKKVHFDYINETNSYNSFPGYDQTTNFFDPLQFQDEWGWGEDPSWTFIYAAIKQELGSLVIVGEKINTIEQISYE